MRTISQYTLIVFVLGSWLWQAACVEQTGRSCRYNTDCIDSAPRIYCDPQRGICVGQVTECTPGAVESCYDGPSETAKYAPCRAGQRFCLQNGRWSACRDAVYPSREICDRQDNDCNGKIDDVEGAPTDPNQPHPCQCYAPGSRRSCYSGPNTTYEASEGRPRGSCQIGVQFCEADGQGKNWWGRCYDQLLPSAEICDGLDNDCNGKIDDHRSCTCTAGETRPCYPGDPRFADVGNCKRGVQSCGADGQWETTCKGAVLPKLWDECGGGDQDCDGKVDEECNCQGALCASNTCVNTETWNDQHCGACNNPCTSAQRCERDPLCKSDDPFCAFQCVCKSDAILCNGACVDAQQNPQHCGACNNSCAVGAICEQGKCTQTTPSCPTGTTRCTEDCVNLQENNLHCGACNNPCPAKQRCEKGRCTDSTSTCPSGQELCGGACVNLQENNLHCGACGKACSDGQDCVSSRCLWICEQGQTYCPSGCVALYQDNNHCGGCGLSCSVNQDCVQARCTERWSLGIGGSGIEHLHAMVADDAGNLLLVGRFTGNLTAYNLQATGGSDAFVIKIAPNQKVVWAKKIGGLGDDTAKSIAIDRQGSLYIAGSFQQTLNVDGKTVVSNGAKDAFWLKMDPTNGEVLWIYRGGGKEDDEADSIAVSSNGDLYITGTFQDKATFYDNTIDPLQADKFKDIFLIKTNHQGLPLWLRQVSGPANNENPRVIVSTNQDPVLFGGFRAMAQIHGITLQADKVDIFVARFDPQGKVLWAKKAGGIEDDYATAAIALPDHSIVLAGHFKQTAQFGAHHLAAMGNNADIFLARIQPDGTFAWAERFGGDGREEVGAIAPHPKGISVVGYYNGKSGFGSFRFPLNQGVNDNNAFVATFSLSAQSKPTVLWAIGTGGLDLEQPTALARYSASLYVGGVFEKQATLLGQTLSSQGDRDIFLWRLSE